MDVHEDVLGDILHEVLLAQETPDVAVHALEVGAVEVIEDRGIPRLRAAALVGRRVLERGPLTGGLIELGLHAGFIQFEWSGQV